MRSDIGVMGGPGGAAAWLGRGGVLCDHGDGRPDRAVALGDAFGRGALAFRVGGALRETEARVDERLHVHDACVPCGRFLN